ncbi:NAD-glutamate dehydrogenase [Tomitella biformata]|uniref:NAD-glutamate dehydrogenase n=1 Tax=Tomitella biformata TaxID=630403 RepID=UPI000466C582|nr:NAD-glutamate dehydrogenase [Tomitella biformata]
MAEQVDGHTGANVSPEFGARALARLYRQTQTHGRRSTQGKRADELAATHSALAAVRTPGSALVRIWTDETGNGQKVVSYDSAVSSSAKVGPLPNVGDYIETASILQVVTDDAPFLVESLTALLGSSGIGVDHIVHPILLVERDEDGQLGRIHGEIGDVAEAAQGIPESWIHLELTGTPRALLPQLELRVRELLADISWVVDDTTAMRAKMTAIAADLDAGNGIGVATGDEAAECAELLRWMADGNLAILGYRRYRVTEVAADRDGGLTTEQSAVDASGLGVLHSGEMADRRFRLHAADESSATRLLMLTQGQSSALALHAVHPFYVAIRIFDEQNRQIGEHRFLGVFTVTSLHRSVFDIPVLSRRTHQVLERSGYSADSYSGQSVLEIIESYPRTEMFATGTTALLNIVNEVLSLGINRGVRLFLRADRNGRFVSALVYLPRDRYTTAVRLRMRAILVAELGGISAEYNARVSESSLAMVHYTVQTPNAWDNDQAPDLSEENRVRIQDLLTEQTRSWDDSLAEAARTVEHGIQRALITQYGKAFPDSYKEDFIADDALEDIVRLEALAAHDMEVAWRRDPRGREGQWRFMMYIADEGISLSQVLPVLQSLGVDVIFERPYPLTRPDGTRCWVYSFAITVVPDLRERTDITPMGEVGERFIENFVAVWERRAETDRFNELVMRAGLTWRQAMVLRAYGKYLRQAGFAYSQTHIQNVLCSNPQVVASLSELFHAQFDPDLDVSADAARADEIAAEIAAELKSIISIDTDRVLRAYLHLIRGTVRTNYFMLDENGESRSQLSLKLAAQEIPELPEPRPLYEIYVYSPRIEGVHLRFGKVARGGLRWSDRLEDFRTEVLGLVKAQAVKNAVIVPLGAKGGFVVKKAPVPTGDEAADRDAFRNEGVHCYRKFIAGLLDVTDNLARGTGEVVPPARVVRRDGDDTYLVVAADKGTAAFSDIANGVSEDYDFWLADAFASGGSSGYDHKQMAITARGAWESVKRHFWELGLDTQTQEFTAVGVGDMSGDVFGNGMLRSEHTRLVAAFDHRHIFIDPDPNARSGFVERQRLYDLPRSSWADYDTRLISKGGGVWDRSLKSIPISPQMRTALGLADGVLELSAPELMRAVLRAPVDLFWNGGIGTYIKAHSETHAEVGDKANDGVRVDGRDMRVRVIGEGGNLGVTQLGRIEFALEGRKINTDAIDNSAGVDSSDREVNIKILLEHAIGAGQLERGKRDELLASMTEEVSDLVLADNRSQNRVLGVERARSTSMMRVHERLIIELEREHGLNRELEGLPSEAEFNRREAAGLGITSPELSVLLAHVKLTMKGLLLDGDVPDIAALSGHLPEYFPTPLRERFADVIADHPLRREILATVLTNQVVDGGGITYAFRLRELAGVSAEDSVRAFAAVSEIFLINDVWAEIDSADISSTMADEMKMETRRLLDRASRWFLTNRPQPLAIAAETSRFTETVATLADLVPELVIGSGRARVQGNVDAAVEKGAPAALATTVFGLLDRFPLLDICTIADVTNRDAEAVARLYFALSGHLQLDALLVAVSRLDRGDRWHALARLTLREDLYAAMRALCIDVLESAAAADSAEQKIRDWEQHNEARLSRARAALTDIMALGNQDLATLSVAARQFRSMIHVGSHTAS